MYAPAAVATHGGAIQATTRFSPRSEMRMADTGWISEMVAAWNAKDGERTASFFEPQGCYEDVAKGFRLEGREAIAWMFSEGVPAVSADCKFEVENAVCDDRAYAFQWRWTGTHNETGRVFDIRGAAMGQLRDGLIAHNVDYWDPSQLPDAPS